MAGPLTHDRDLSKFRDAYGIKSAEYADSVELAGRLQATVAVDDARHLIRPVPVPVGIFNYYKAAVVGLFSAARLTVRSAGGLYLIAVRATGGNQCMFNVAAGAFTTTALATFAITGGGGAPISDIETGTMAAVPATPGRINLSSNVSSAFVPIWLDYGDEFFMAGTAANTLINCAMMIQEIP
ncbi:unnamed protein product [marine sediment metagenome]|uniref:Uncharacterized protein n=1 Tax=marine sediment metagenome TaxID=412755 RepID=X1RMT3_9ZZZZ